MFLKIHVPATLAVLFLSRIVPDKGQDFRICSLVLLSLQSLQESVTFKSCLTCALEDKALNKALYQTLILDCKLIVY